MKDLQDLRDPLVFLDPLALLDLLAPLVIPARGALLVSLVCLELMEFLDLLAPRSCCLSVSVRVEEIKVLLFLHKKPRQQPSCRRPGWL